MSTFIKLFPEEKEIRKVLEETKKDVKEIIERQKKIPSHRRPEYKLPGAPGGDYKPDASSAWKALEEKKKEVISNAIKQIDDLADKLPADKSKQWKKDARIELKSDIPIKEKENLPESKFFGPKKTQPTQSRFLKPNEPDEPGK